MGSQTEVTKDRPETVRELIHTLGKDTVMSALRVKYPSIKAARLSNSMPGSWFGVIERLCGERDLALSRALFNFREFDSQKTSPSTTPLIKGATK